MAEQRHAPERANSKGISRTKPQMLIGHSGRTLHIWRGLNPLPRIKAIWRNDKGSAHSLTEQDPA